MPALRFGFAQAVKQLAAIRINPGISALKAEDRLFEIPNDKQTAKLVTLAAPGKKLLHQRADHLPLRQICVLRFVNQHMIDTAIQLETHPIGRAWRTQQPHRRRDHIRIINHAGAGLGGLPILRQLHGQPQMPAGIGQDLPTFLAGANGLQLVLHLAAQRPPAGIGIIKRLGNQPGDHPRQIIGSEKNTPQQRPLLRRIAQGQTGRQRISKLKRIDAFLPPQRLGQISQLRPRQARQCRRQIGLRAAAVRRQPHKAPQQRINAFDALRRQRVGMGSGGGHDVLQPRFTAVQRHFGQIGAQAGIAGHHAGQRVPQHPAAQHDAGAVVQRLKSGADLRFDREAGNQALRKAVDGLDRQTGRRFEDGGKQPARPVMQLRQRFGVTRHANCSKFAGQCGIAAPHPMRQPCHHAVLHFGCCQLGEGQAQYRLRPRPSEQQPQHPRDQHLGLAGASRCRHPGMAIGIGCQRLFRQQRRQWLCHAHRLPPRSASGFGCAEGRGRLIHSGTRAR